MIKNELAINVFKNFIEDNGRMPTYREFMELGYCKAHYYNVKANYLKMKEEEDLNKEAIKDKI